MKILILNPNSTAAMTDSVAATARAVLPAAEIVARTNHDGPPAIQGPEDGAAAVPGLMSFLGEARAIGADAIIIACFDDTGLDQLRAAAPCPVIGIGQAAYHMAALLGARFGVVTTLPVSVPVIEGNIHAQGFAPASTGVRASNLGVLEVDAGGPDVIARLRDEILAAHRDGAQSVILGCAGMSAHLAALSDATQVPLVDGVRAATLLAAALCRMGAR